MTFPVTPPAYTAGMTRRTPLTHGSLALKLDFGGATLPRRAPAPLAAALRTTRRPDRHDKYKVLEHRRRQAQIAARRLLDLMEGE